MDREMAQSVNVLTAQNTCRKSGNGSSTCNPCDWNQEAISYLDIWIGDSQMDFSFWRIGPGAPWQKQDSWSDLGRDGAYSDIFLMISKKFFIYKHGVCMHMCVSICMCICICMFACLCVFVCVHICGGKRTALYAIFGNTSRCAFWVWGSQDTWFGYGQPRSIPNSEYPPHIQLFNMCFRIKLSLHA